MQDAGNPEACFEGLTIQAIICVTNDNGKWKPFRVALEMSKESAYPQTVKELEDVMIAYASALPE